jgi:o-succinylbenzoate synthase
VSPPGLRLRRLSWQRALAAPVGGAWGGLTTRSGLFLALERDGFAPGWGEVSPLPGFSAETLAACDSALARVGAGDLAALIEAPSGPTREALLDGLALPNAARFGLETALLDAEAKARGLTLATLLSGRPPASRVPLSLLLGSASSSAPLLEAAKSAVNEGYSCLKLKLGGAPFADELAALVALRALIGEHVALRLDPNGRFPLDDLDARLAALAAVSPVWIEEPVPLDVLLTLPPTPIPWAADESLVSPALAARLFASRPPSCVAVVLKPALLGGLVRTRALALSAQRAGLAVVVTHLFDGPVAHAAACELALSLDAPAPAGLAPHAVTRAFAVPIAQLPGGPFVWPAHSPGLGLSVSPEELAS